MIQAGFFFKQLTAPQVEITIPGGLSLIELSCGLLLADVAIVTRALPWRRDHAVHQWTERVSLWLELSFQQHLSYLPGVLSGLGVSANYSYTASREKGLPLRTDSPTTIDQAPNTWNISPTYDTKRFSARVGLAYNGTASSSTCTSRQPM